MFKILIAEDDRELRQLFEHVLRKNGIDPAKDTVLAFVADEIIYG